MSYESMLPCIVCGLRIAGMVTYHHIYTRKAYPEYAQKKWNLVSVCLKCHNEVHRIGNTGMSRRHPSYHNWLVQNGWELVGGKWLHENN